MSLCREVFGETLNEGRDPDRGDQKDRYTARYFLKHTLLEKAFDALAAAGFRIVACSATGTNGVQATATRQTSALVIGHSEEDRWGHYNEFLFARQ